MIICRTVQTVVEVLLVGFLLSAKVCVGDVFPETLKIPDQLQCPRQRPRNYEDPNRGFPTLVWTFPGSGTDWISTLFSMLEDTKWTEVYRPNLKKLWKDRRVGDTHEFVRTAQDLVVLKAHVTWNPLKYIPHDIMPNVVMVIRHPFKCILSEFTRRQTHDKASKITTDEFDRSKYIRFFHDYGPRWNNMFKDDIMYGPFIEKYPDKYMVVKYEEMTIKADRLDLFSRILAFVGMPQLANDPEVIKCAFAKAELPRLHRGTGSQTNIPLGSVPVTAPWVYQNDTTVQIFWGLVKETAVLFGYTATNYD